MSYFCSSQMDMDTLHINLRLLISLKENPRHKTLSECYTCFKGLGGKGTHEFGREKWCKEEGRDWRAENGDGFDPDIVMHG